MRRKLKIAAVAALAAGAATPAVAHERGPGAFDRLTPAYIAQQRPEPPLVATPRAECLPGGLPEGPIQGRVPAGADQGYRCNLTVVSRSGSTGGFRVHRYADRNGHDCAYYDTTLLFPTNTLNLSLEPTGVAVLDMTNPARPVRTASLLTPAMQTPHESLNISVERGLLAAVAGNPAAAPGIVDVYDVSRDCRHPELLFSGPVSMFGHESGMAPDGRTFYPTSIGTGNTVAVDISNPRLPRALTDGRFNTHGMSVSDDGNRGYLAASQGLIIVDLSEVQARRPNPRIREISRLSWSNITIPQFPIPVTIDGRPYVVEVDEYSSDENGDVTSHGDRVGAARIIDVSDERNPFVVSNIRLQVHQPEHRAAIANDPGARNPTQGYAAHYCNVPQRVEPGILACSMILSGLRVFDIRDPRNPKEIAYHVAPPSTVSETGSPVIDERANWAMSQPAFVPERGEIWYSDGTSGFYALRMDPRVWPFPVTRGAGGCVDTLGFVSVSARPAGRGLRIGFERRADLPVRVDVFRVSAGRRVLSERLVARFDRRTRGFRWNGRPTRGKRRGGRGPGQYFVRFTMVGRDGSRYDRQRIVLRRDARGRFRLRPPHHRRDGCALLRSFKLERPVFGGRAGTPLAGAYQLNRRGRVTVTIRRRGRIVKRFATAERPARTTFRFRLPARRLPKGDYSVHLLAQSGDDQVSSILTSRRL